MIEKTMRGTLVKLLKSIGAYAVENGGCHPGTPDIATVLGPIECKATNEWPARAETPVKLDHDLTNAQRIFIMKWVACKGRAWVMLNVNRQWLLFQGMAAVGMLGGNEPGTRQELLDTAVQVWNRTPTTQELLRVLYET